eukprot:CAMPEP_0183292936 /NCGR_PEP_ID=MMETSP0160_2-20130417/1819_1 /TAXON_ID=2839 ORGANISM="Odontella Sinensis, Strain Grunow 1884" /NCGR_SAMPLE_ID=MMETSP0160_2 /ASSEMBLY_ACC=CAM_ASM_000250 /LENGTH=189 /DNA_ID=CAMNT_0025453977 /DNA_START=120 /DNA_END=689 /DNA_ORIENTATION=+
MNTFSLILAFMTITVVSTTPIEGSEVARTSTDDTATDLTYLNGLNDYFLPNFFPSAFLNHRQLFGVDSEFLHRSSPHYDILHLNDRIEVTLEVTGYKYHEIEVELKAGGRVLSISGQREEMKENENGQVTSTKSSFQQSFTLDPSVETEKMSANLADGKLVITAPRHEAMPGSRKIPVTQFDEEALDEM